MGWGSAQGPVGATLVRSLAYKDSVRMASTGNLTLSGLQTIDAIVGAAEDRVLAKDQTAPAENGIYRMRSGAWIRADDADEANELEAATAWVEEGTANANTEWNQTADSITVGVTGLTWVLIGGSGAAAPVDASYLTLGLNGTLTAERVATGTANITIADGGANGTATFDTAQAITAGASPTFVGVTLSGLTVDAFIFSGTASALTSTAAPTNGQLLVGSTGAAPVAAALTGTVNQITITNGAGSITLTTPQNIHSGASPTFVGLTLSGLTADAFIFSGTASTLTSTAAPTNGQLLIGSTGVAPAVATITGTADQITVTNGAGSITLSAPQSIGSGSSPTFVGLTLSGLTDGEVIFPISGVLSGDAGLFWNNTGKRLGVGAGSPEVVLDVEGLGVTASYFGVVAKFQNTAASTPTECCVLPTTGTQVLAGAVATVFKVIGEGNTLSSANNELVQMGTVRQNHGFVNTAKAGSGTQRKLVLSGEGGDVTVEASFHHLVLETNGDTGFGIFDPTAFIHAVQTVKTSGSPTALLIVGGAHTTLAAGVEAIDDNFNNARTVQFATGALATQRAAVFQAPTYAFVAASTITTAATLAITAAPVAGTNATITTALALWIQAGKTQLAGELELDGDFNHDGTNLGVYGVTPVARSTGWTLSNDSTDRTINFASFTLDELGDGFATLVRDLAATGIIGAVS